MSPQCRMKRSTAAGSFFLPVISVMTEISDEAARLSSAPAPLLALHTIHGFCLKISHALGNNVCAETFARVEAGSRMVQKLRQQRDLFESERSFRLLVEGVADYALYMLDPTGIITSWNIGGERIKGYSPKEIIGQHFSRFYTEADRADGKPARALGIARDQGRYEEEGWRVRKDGTFFWASVIIDPIYEGGELV